MALLPVNPIGVLVPRVGHDPTRTIQRPTVFETALYANSKHLGLKWCRQRATIPQALSGHPF